MGFLNKMIIKNKKGLSEIIAYVLLITVAITVSIAVYGFLQSYLPGEVDECPEGVSLVLGDYECDEENLNITLINNGKFNVTGFAIKVTNNTERLATCGLVDDDLGERREIGENFFNEPLSPNDYSDIISFKLGHCGFNDVEELKIEMMPIRDGRICRNAIFERVIEC